MEDIFERWKKGLARSSKAAFGHLAVLLNASEIKDETWDELEALLIQADLGMGTTRSIIDSLKNSVNKFGITKTQELKPLVEKELRSRLDDLSKFIFDNKPYIILIVGVNGSGKTTTIAKLGKKFSDEGRKVLLVGADTFRAAAVDQLQIWAERLKIPIIAGQPGSDPGAVIYDAIQSAMAKQVDVVLIDTAGRLHTRYNLMEELKKVYRICGKALPGAPHAVWMVLDATTGQNALMQGKSFKEAVNVSGVVLAKLDGSSKGGMAFAIQRELQLPILYAGLGETPDDLQPFNRDEFIKNLLN